MRKIIADSSSLILLHKCGAAEELFQNCCCIIPETVREELTEEGYDGADFFKQCITKGALTVKKNKFGIEPVKRLHKGESGVVSLYKEGEGEYIIIDDGGGAAFCRDNGIPYINALLAVKILLFSGIIDQENCDAMFAWLMRNGRYSKAVIEWGEKADSDKLKEFLF